MAATCVNAVVLLLILYQSDAGEDAPYLRAEFEKACIREGLTKAPSEVVAALCMIDEGDDTNFGNQLDANMSAIRVLDLHHCPLGVDAMRALGSSLVSRHGLESLSLAKCLDAADLLDGMEGLAESLEASLHGAELESLELVDCPLDAAGDRALHAFAGRVLSRLTNLRSLRLSSCGLTDDAVQEIVAGVLRGARDVRAETSNLAHLDLSSNRLARQGGAAAIARLLNEGTPLRVLCLADNDIGAQGFETIANAVHRSGTLRFLDASRTGIPCVAAIRSLVEYLQDDGKCALEVLKLQECTTAVDARCVELLGAALAMNASVREVDLRNPRHLATCNEAALITLAECLGTNSTLATLSLGEIDEDVMTPAEAHDALAPLRRILVLNAKLDALLKSRTAAAGAEAARARSVVSSSAAANSGRLSSHSSSSSNGSSNGSYDSDSRSENNRALARNVVDSIRSQDRKNSQDAHRTRCPDSDSSAMQMVQELRTALRAVRDRTDRHHVEIEDRVSARLFELDSRVSTISNRQFPKSTHASQEPLWNDEMQRRTDNVEARLQHAGEQTSRVGEFAKTLRSQVSDMAASLAKEAEAHSESLTFDENAVYNGGRHERANFFDERLRQCEQRIASVLDKAFGDAEQEVTQLQRTFSHDFDKKQDIWRKRLEAQFAQVVDRVDLLEQSVVTLHDENILALETLLQDRRQRSRRDSRRR
ncbi:Ribonuclease inhibitor [Hondaea fermentalgiana]|uniref:Ribonuclease inhibitor n=1 Tax=Hondaea fermentalgiana TaxID=2315210 RepID=A0A2R5GT17_9STRA|nr:Ribonuclease inhibitor [Hondaea fermentalgiana]|eukprot:GBG31024.1 Ribonuclease inhibitor [Hondaea fermentalgiana]